MPFGPLRCILLPSLSLSHPVEGEELYLYLVTSTIIVSITLVSLGPDSKKLLVYFVNKALSEVGTRNIDFE